MIGKNKNSENLNEVRAAHASLHMNAMYPYPPNISNLDEKKPKPKLVMISTIRQSIPY
jgi:hypothetical protein